MTCDFNTYHIMDASLEGKVHGVLLLALEMAKASFPHLVEEIAETERRYTARLEAFTGSQNKPSTHKSYHK